MFGREDSQPFSTASEKAQKTAISTLPVEACVTMRGGISASSALSFGARSLSDSERSGALFGQRLRVAKKR